MEVYNETGLNFMHKSALDNNLEAAKLLCGHIRMYGKGNSNDSY